MLVDLEEPITVKQFYIKKYFDKIEFIAPNTNFYFDPESPLSKSKDANISDATFYSTKILAHDKTEKIFLIDANKIFSSQVLTELNTLKDLVHHQAHLVLGSFDKEKSKINEIKIIQKIQI